MELRRQISVLRAWIWLLLGSIVLAAGAAYLVSTNLPKVYEGRVTLIVGQSTQATNPDLNQLLASQRLSQTYAELATTGPLLEEVIAKNGLTVSVDEFRERITAEAPRDSILVNLVVEDGDPARAATLANSLAARDDRGFAGHRGAGLAGPAVHRRRPCRDADPDRGNAGGDPTTDRAVVAVIR